MEFQAPEIQLGAIAPEVALSITALVVLLLDAFAGERRNRWYLPILATIGLGVSIYLAIGVWGDTELHLGGMVVVDGVSTFSKVALAGFGLLTVWVAHD